MMPTIMLQHIEPNSRKCMNDTRANHNRPMVRLRDRDPQRSKIDGKRSEAADRSQPIVFIAKLPRVCSEIHI
jgi:hypothetical protein